MHQSKMSQELQPAGDRLRPAGWRRIASVLMILLLPGLLGAWQHHQRRYH